MKHVIQHIKPSLLLVIPLIALAMVFNSCGSDEPDWLVGYYMTINSQVSLNLSDNDESQGTTSNPNADVLSNTIAKMKIALRSTYPEPTLGGNDAAVIKALDEIFKTYKAMYGNKERNTICTVKLYRARMDGEIVKRSTAMKAYHFGALPQNTDEAGL